MKNNGEIIFYHPESTLKMEVRIENETVWLTQAQIAELFGVKQPAISKHLKNIYDSVELNEDCTYSILEYMGNDGKQRYQTKFYNLDVILSVGYRVNSKNATQFRIWANKVLKDYLLKGYYLYCANIKTVDFGLTASQRPICACYHQAIQTIARSFPFNRR